MTKLTNDELLKMSDPNVPQNVKDYICKQKMTEEEVILCEKLHMTLSDFMIANTIE